MSVAAAVGPLTYFLTPPQMYPLYSATHTTRIPASFHKMTPQHLFFSPLSAYACSCCRPYEPCPKKSPSLPTTFHPPKLPPPVRLPSPQLPCLPGPLVPLPLSWQVSLSRRAKRVAQSDAMLENRQNKMSTQQPMYHAQDYH